MDFVQISRALLPLLGGQREYCQRGALRDPAPAGAGR